MKTIGKYIIEKLKLSKDICDENNATWLKHCEKIISDYLDRKISHSNYNGEYTIKYEYTDNKLKIIFTEPIAFAYLQRYAVDLLAKLGYEEELISSFKDPDIKCINNKWTIIFNV